jgi:hypothetical protein
MSSGDGLRSAGPLQISHHPTIDDVAEVPLEDSHRLLSVEAMTHRLIGTFSHRRGQGRGAVEASKTSLALASLFNFVFAAVTFILFGLAVALSDVYPRWLGWVVFLAGLGSIGAGLIKRMWASPPARPGS